MCSFTPSFSQADQLMASCSECRPGPALGEPSPSLEYTASPSFSCGSTLPVGRREESKLSSDAARTKGSTGRDVSPVPKHAPFVHEAKAFCCANGRQVERVCPPGHAPSVEGKAIRPGPSALRFRGAASAISGFALTADQVLRNPIGATETLHAY